MLIRDRHMDPSAKIARQRMRLGLAPAINLTNAVLSLQKFEQARKVLSAAIYARTVVGSVACKLVAVPQTGLIVGTTLAIDAVPEKFKTMTTTAVYLVSKAVKTKAPATAIAFSAAYTVNNAQAAGLFWGAFLVQVNAAGTVSTKAVANDQAYATEASAIAALPEPDAGNVTLGYITVKTKTSAVKWTAQTDDLTDGSDVTDANFYSATARECLTGAITAVSLTDVDGTVSDTTANNTVEADEMLAVICTTDGTGALTDGELKVETRAARVFRGE